jgi:PAS domain-containing protein
MATLYTEVHEQDLMAHVANPKASFAYSCWLLACGGEVPTEEAFLARRIDWLLPDMMILRPAGGGDFLYVHYGATIVAAAGFDMTGKRVADFQGEIGAFYRTWYANVVETGRPIATVHRLGAYNERPIWERVILPLRQADGEIALYVVNCVRQLGEDIAKLSAQSRGAGVMALQFQRDDRGIVTDALIAGANPAALQMTGRRLDEVLDRSIRECFPGVVHLMLWERYLEVSRTREEQSFRIDYRQDGLDDLFDVRLFPFRDGVAIEFRLMPREAPAAQQSDLIPA